MIPCSYLDYSGAMIPRKLFFTRNSCRQARGINMFLMNCWYVAALDHELIDSRLLSRTLLGERVLLYRGESGKVFALNDRCPHRGALLSQGRLEGEAVRCMYHGIKYDGTGKCVQIPGQDMIPPKLRVPTYPVIERSHFIWIWMGEPA